jgi:lipoate---protein ligase
VTPTGVLPPAGGLALDEALARTDPTEPLIAVWRSSPAVIVGRFQRPEWEVDAAACAARGVRVWRRFTGGGTVYLDPGVVCATLVIPGSHPDAHAGVPQMYEPFLEGIVHACASLGVAATHDERTVRLDGRKITGIAAHRNRGATLVHGTLLVSADLAALTECIAGPRGGELDGAPRPSPSRPDHVTNIGGSVAAAEAAILAAFPSARSLTSDRLEPAVRDAADELLSLRYLSTDWHAGPWKDVTPEPILALLGGK